MSGTSTVIEVTVEGLSNEHVIRRSCLYWIPPSFDQDYQQLEQLVFDASNTNIVNNHLRTCSEDGFKVIDVKFVQAPIDDIEDLESIEGLITPFYHDKYRAIKIHSSRPSSRPDTPIMRLTYHPFPIELDNNHDTESILVLYKKKYQELYKEIYKDYTIDSVSLHDMSTILSTTLGRQCFQYYTA